MTDERPRSRKCADRPRKDKVPRLSIGLKEALRLTVEGITPLPAEQVSLVDSVGRIAAADLYSLVDSPSIDASLKDGYALSCSDIADATAENPVRLRLLGSVPAGGETDIRIERGTAIKVLTGAPIPAGADAVVAAETVKQQDNEVLIDASVKSGTNILRRGSDAALGNCILRSGQEISPCLTGLLAAAGHSVVPVFSNPVVGIIATGDEIVEPGTPLAEGKLYASNIVTIAGWCSRYRMKNRTVIVRDDHDAIINTLKRLSWETDALVTSGGAWTGDRDIVAQVLEGLGWEEVFHRIRIGPGKAVGYGI